MAEQLICNQQVDGSTPFTSSIFGGFPERPKGADCKSVVTDFGGPNPPSPTRKKHFAEVLFSRTFNIACVSFFINPFFIVFQQKTDPLGWSFVVLSH